MDRAVGQCVSIQIFVKVVNVCSRVVCFVLHAPFSLWRIITLATTTLSHLHMCNPQNYGFMVQ